jgi:hypothetical protein
VRTGNKKLSSEEIQNIVNLYGEGKSALRVARETGRNHSTILSWLDKLGVPRHPAYRSSKPRMEMLCACGCGRVFFTIPSSLKKYYSPECYSEFRLKLKGIKIVCEKCKKEIPKECARLNEGKCFMCWFKGRKILPHMKNCFEN